MITISHSERGATAEWTAPATEPAGRVRIAVLWHKALDYLVPIGYENETGFHYGQEPHPQAEADARQNAA